MPYYAGRKQDPELDDSALKSKREDTIRASQMSIGGQSPDLPPGGNNVGDSGPSAGRFVSFGQMFGLNKPQAQGMANTITGNVVGQGAANDKQFGEALNKFNSDVSKGTNTYSDPQMKNPNVKTTVGPGLESTPTRQQEDTKKVINPRKLPPRERAPAPPGAITQQELAAKGQQGYTGPADLASSAGSEWEKLLGNAKKTSTAANQLTTQEGQQTQLQNAYGNQGGYGAAMGGGSSYASKMDAALAGAAGNATGQFQSAKDRYGNQEQRFNEQNANSGAQVDNAKLTSDTSAARYRDFMDQWQKGQAAAQAAVTPAPYVVGAINPVLGQDADVAGGVSMIEPQIRKETGMNDTQSADVWNAMSEQERADYRAGKYDPTWLWNKYNSIPR